MICGKFALQEHRDHRARVTGNIYSLSNLMDQRSRKESLLFVVYFLVLISTLKSFNADYSVQTRWFDVEMPEYNTSNNLLMGRICMRTKWENLNLPLCIVGNHFWNQDQLLEYKRISDTEAVLSRTSLANSISKDIAEISKWGRGESGRF